MLSNVFLRQNVDKQGLVYLISLHLCHDSKEPISVIYWQESVYLTSNALLMPRSSIWLGCWSVRSLGNPERQKGHVLDVLQTMKE